MMPRSPRFLSDSEPPDFGFKKARRVRKAPYTRALVIDGEPTVVDATCVLLEAEGFEIFSAASECEIKSAIEKRGWSPDIVIAGYHLPGDQSGLDIVCAVREMAGSQVPAIVFSGDTTGRINVNGVAGTTLLKKPVGAGELLAEIYKAIGDA